MSPIATSMRLGHMTASAFTVLSTSTPVTASPPFPVVVVIVVVAVLSVALAAYTVWHEAYAAPQAVDDEEAKAFELIVIARYCAVCIVVPYSPVSSRHALEFENVDNHSSIKRDSRVSAYAASTFRTSVHVNDDSHLQGLYAHSPSPSYIPSASTVFSACANSSPVRIEPFPQDSEEDELDITNAGAFFGPGTYSLRAYEGRDRARPTPNRVCTPPLQLFATAVEFKGELNIANIG